MRNMTLFYYKMYFNWKYYTLKMKILQNIFLDYVAKSARAGFRAS